jgi:hypothetical protein
MSQHQRTQTPLPCQWPSEMDPAHCLQDGVEITKWFMFHQMKKTGVRLGENLQSAHKWRNEMSAVRLCFGVALCKTVSLWILCKKKY